MFNLEEKLDFPVFRYIQEAADSLGLETYVVGGWVRDAIMNRSCKDIDVVTIGNGIKLANKLHDILGSKASKVSVFRNFGTAMINFKDGDEVWQIEFVGARKESYNRDSRKPIVEDGTLEDDQNRRDFTINAMAICLNKENYGKLLDPFNGINDIKNQIIQTPLDPDITFSDDPLRMLRAIRFASRLDFSIHPDTFDAIKRNAYRIEIVSMERNIEEINKMIMSAHPSMAFRLMDKSGLLERIIPELVKLKGTESVGEKSHKDNFKHTLEVLENISKKTDDLYLRWAAILHDIGKPYCKRYDEKTGFSFHGHETKGSRMIKNIFRRLKLPLNEKMKYVEKLVALHLRPIILAESVVTDSAVRRLLFEAGDDIDDLMALCQADVTSKNMNKVKQYMQNFETVKRKLLEIEEKDRVRNFQPPVDGEEIMQIFNIAPCREIGTLKTIIKDAILDGIIPNEREAALDLLYKEAEKIGLKRVL
ncbi:MAG: HD domain-containing protein [Bacteroidales bacterium]|nr:HD domain-containing protein [Bacteroidales bacterium]